MHILVSTIKINILLKIFNRVHRLTWHNGAIPEEEIWIKLGGDKGGGTFKFNFQICNTPTPNSPRNTCVFSIFAAPDTITNLHTAADRYCSQVSSLLSTFWR